MSKTVPAWVADYVGLPFLRCGRTREGLDCWGLVSLVLSEQYGISLPDYSGTGWGNGPARAVAETIEREAGAYWREVPASGAQPGDVLLMTARGLPIHVGVLVAPGWILHAEETADTCLEPLDSPHFRRRIAGFYRHVSRFGPDPGPGPGG